jgi:DNA-binding NarL/FixJ family response regulator
MRMPQTKDARKHRVLIVDDDPSTLRKLSDGVRKSDRLTVCGTASTLKSGTIALAKLKPDFLLVDVGLPDGSGTDLIALATAAAWPCNSMVVSVFGDQRRVIDAICAGAKGYLLKTTELDHVALSIESVIAGGSPMSPKIARHLLTRVFDMSSTDNMPPDTHDAAPDVQLTKRETEVLGAIAKGYKRQEVADILNITVGTVGNHINNIYQKLQVGSNIAAVAAATRIGLL